MIIIRIDTDEDDPWADLENEWEVERRLISPIKPNSPSSAVTTPAESSSRSEMESVPDTRTHHQGNPNFNDQVLGHPLHRIFKRPVWGKAYRLEEPFEDSDRPAYESKEEDDRVTEVVKESEAEVTGQASEKSPHQRGRNSSDTTHGRSKAQRTDSEANIGSMPPPASRRPLREAQMTHVSMDNVGRRAMCSSNTGTDRSSSTHPHRDSCPSSSSFSGRHTDSLGQDELIAKHKERSRSYLSAGQGTQLNQYIEEDLYESIKRSSYNSPSQTPNPPSEDALISWQRQQARASSEWSSIRVPTLSATTSSEPPAQRKERESSALNEEVERFIGQLTDGKKSLRGTGVKFTRMSGERLR